MWVSSYLFSVDNERVSVSQRTVGATLDSLRPFCFQNKLSSSPALNFPVWLRALLCTGMIREAVLWKTWAGCQEVCSVQTPHPPHRFSHCCSCLCFSSCHCSCIPLLVASFRCMKCLWAHRKSMLEWQTVTADFHFLAIDPISSLMVNSKLSGILQH